MKNYYTLKNIIIFIVFITFIGNTNAQENAVIGQWSEPIQFDIVPVAVANLPDGKLITWSAKFTDTFGGADGATYTEIFDPFLGTDGQAMGTTVSNTNHDMFCPGINNLPDGRILAAGGSSSERVSIYDYNTGIWTVADDMNVPRGYQGNVTLSDGSVFTIGGSWSGGEGGKSAEIWTHNTGWIELPSLQGELLIEGNDPILDEPEGIYRSDNHAWLFPAPNGKIFHAGPGTDMHWIDVRDINNPQVENLGKRLDDVYSMNGNAVFYDIGKLLKLGGSRSYGSGSPSSDSSYIIDINNEVPNVEKVTSFKRTRSMHNSTVLPNGKVLLTGGLATAELFSDIDARYIGEIFDPNSKTWIDTAPMQVARTYHSVAILMQDGRVFVGGGGLCVSGEPNCTNHFNAEIYSPPYLFKQDGTGDIADRPIISAPENADYNSDIIVTGSLNINEFSLIRFSSNTHSINNEQRRVPLLFNANGANYEVSIPNRELLPPGYYMLFAIDENGVPSVAESIKIGSAIAINNNPNLVLDLNFEEGIGNTIVDNSIYQNNATIIERDNNTNEIPLTQNFWSSDGLIGNSLEMDGALFDSNSLVEIPFSDSMASIKEQVTVMAWVYRDEVEYNVSVFSHDYPKLFFGFHNSLFKWEFPTTNGSINIYSGYSPPQKWIHIAATYDGKIGKLYANGVEINSDFATGDITLETADQYFSSFTVSGFYDRQYPGNGSGITDELDGKIDELKVFNKALSAEAIINYYQKGVSESNNVLDCSTENIITQYKIGLDGEWVNNDVIMANEGDQVYIRAITPENKAYMVTLPIVNGPTISSIDDFPNFEDTSAYKINTNIYNGNGAVNSSNNGKYAFTTIDGCVRTITLNVDSNEVCNIVQEYFFNGTWQSGQSTIQVDEGTDVILSILPNGIGLTTTLPNGLNVGDNYLLGNVTTEVEGIYILTAENGCQKTLKIIVNSNDACNGENEIFQEYSIDGIWQSGQSIIQVDEGTEVILSILPDGIGLTTTLPNGQIVGDNYNLGNITAEDEGIYILTAENGCQKTLEININSNDPCNIVQEYRIDGAWQSGQSILQIDEGTDVILSILPNGIGLTTTLPNGQNVVGDYNLGNVTAENEGIYILTAENGCQQTLEIIVNSNDACNGENEIFQEYSIDGIWQSGQSIIQVDEGTEVILSILPDGIGLTTTLPNGQIVGDNYNLGNITAEDEGIYILTAENGCQKTLEININSNDPCNIVQEYRIDGAWQSGQSILQIDEGTDVILSILPNGIGLTTTLPNGQNVVGDYNLGNVTAENEGIYILTAENGCQQTLEIIVNSNDACNGENEIFQEYSIDGIWQSGQSIIQVDEGTEVILSILPDGIGLATTLPNGQIVGDNYNLGNITAEDEGIYILTAENGCQKTLEININSNDPCNIVQEYRIDGAWQSGQSILQVDEGTDVILSILPNGIGLTTTLPNGQNVVGDYNLGNVTTENEGIYILTAENGCQQTLEIIVNSNDPCNIVQEYRIDGTWQSGQSILQVDEGTEVILSILPNGIGLTTTLPNGQNVVGDYNLGNVTTENEGIYILTAENGCVKTVELQIINHTAARLSVYSTKTTEKIDNSSNLAVAHLLVYPNPTTENINIKFDNSSKLFEQVILRNFNGRILLSQPINVHHEGPISLNSKNLSPGLYHLSLVGKDGSMIYKKIIKK